MRRSQVAVTAVFAAHGLLFASWTAHIPNVKGRLGLSDGTLGFALVGAPVGSVIAMIGASWLLPRLGSQRIVQVALVGYCAAGPLVGLTGRLAMFFAALFLWGAFQGTLDVAMNTQAIAVERTGQRALMSGFHGSWSLGSFAGAGIGALAVAVGVGLDVQLLVMGAIILMLVGVLTIRMLPDAGVGPRSDAPAGTSNHEHQRQASSAVTQPAISRWSGGMLLLAAVGFASMLCEGAAADWAAVYLSGPLHTSGVVPGLGYAAFALTMVIVRLCGNALVTHIGAERLLPALAAIATIGFSAALLIAQPVVGLLGFGCLGAGLAAVVPAVFSAAGRIPGLHPGTAVATASACGWAGFVCGPPLIGWLASATSLPVALGALPLLSAFIAVATHTSGAFHNGPTVDTARPRPGSGGA